MNNNFKKIEDYVSKLSQEEISEINKKEIENTNKQHSEFKKRFSKGKCYICDLKLNEFNQRNPCVHWLLRPKGFKKEHFPLIYKKFRYQNIDAYLRWVANEDKLLQNINDLSDEQEKNTILDYTIKYKNLEWSFSCKRTDFAGHRGRRFGKGSHYHFQMKIKNLSFINYSDFHVPLREEDIFFIKIKRNEIKGFSHQGGFGSGMQALFDNIPIEKLLRDAAPTELYNNNMLHTSYIITADEGKKISGDQVYDIIQKSKKTGKTIWNFLPELENAKATAIVSPGEGVPEIGHRKGGRKKRKNERKI